MSKEEFKFNKSQQKAYDACTPLQRRVVLNMVYNSMSQRQSYFLAGGKAKSPKVADSTVCIMLSKARVKAFMQSLVEEQAKEAIMSREESLEILTSIGRTKITDIVAFKNIEYKDAKGDMQERAIFIMKESDGINPEHAVAIAEVTQGKEGTKIKMHSVPAAIKQISLLQGWDSATKHEHTGKDGGAIETKEILSHEDLARRLIFIFTRADKEREKKAGQDV